MARITTPEKPVRSVSSSPLSSPPQADRSRRTAGIQIWTRASIGTASVGGSDWKGLTRFRPASPPLSRRLRRWPGEPGRPRQPLLVEYFDLAVVHLHQALLLEPLEHAVDAAAV